MRCTRIREFESLFKIIDLFIARIRARVHLILVASYPNLTDACSGASFAMVPLRVIWLIPFVAIPLFVGLLITLQVFPESRRMVTRSTFWAVAFVACLLEFMCSQFLADASSTIFYLFLNGTSVDRTYTTNGVWLTMLQLFRMSLCMSMFYHRHRDEEIRKQLDLTKKQRGTGVLTSISGICERFFDAVFTPSTLFWGLSTIFVILSLMSGPAVSPHRNRQHRERKFAGLADQLHSR